MPIDLIRYAAEFPSLKFSSEEPGILELVMSNQGRLNAATEGMHRDLAQVWRGVDLDDAVRVVRDPGRRREFFLRRRFRHDRSHDRR